VAEEPLDRARWSTLIGFCLVLFVSVSFKSMVGIPIPDLQRDLVGELGADPVAAQPVYVDARRTVADRGRPG
jgi:hypothetical protein